MIKRFDDVEARIIAMLLGAGEPVKRTFLSRSLGLSVQELDAKINELNSTFNEINLPLKIIRVEDRFEAALDGPAGKFASGAFQKTSWPRNLSQAALETLSIIALKQPVTRKEIMKIRGVAPDSSLATLLEIGFIDKIENDNKSYYVTTPKFLKACGLVSLSDLKKLYLDAGKDGK